MGGANGSVPGGLWGTSDPANQRAVLAESFHKLMHTLAVHEIPHTFILFPRMVTDPGYLFDRLSFVLGGTTRTEFDPVFNQIADRSQVHDYQPGTEAVDPSPAAPIADTAAQGRFSGLFGFKRALNQRKAV